MSRPTGSEDLRLGIDGNALIACPSGEIDLSNGELLGNRIADATPPGSLGVVLDLTDVSYIDSYGIMVMLGLRQRLAESRQELAVVVPQGSPVAAAFRLANISAHMEIVEAVD